jgi:hypothetical protein
VHIKWERIFVLVIGGQGDQIGQPFTADKVMYLFRLKVSSVAAFWVIFSPSGHPVGGHVCKKIISIFRSL